MVELGGRRIERALPARQGRLLFAYLVRHRARPVERGELIRALWPKDPPADPAAGLSVVLSRLRRALGPQMVDRGFQIGLRLPATTWIDVEAAVRAVERAMSELEEGNWRQASDAASHALDVIGLGLLTGHDAPWVAEWRDELEEHRLNALQCIAHAGLELGGSGLAEGEQAARELIQRAPFREEGYRLLMECHTARGNIAEALLVYELLRSILRDELGAVPGPRTQTLHRRILVGDPVA